MQKPQVGMIGLAVMGSNLIRNIESKGFSAAVYNRNGAVTDEFMTKFGSGQFTSSHSLQEFVASMRAPRMVFLMIKAGAAVDAVMDELIPLLEKGDVLIDGGNSLFTDTARREERCRQAQLNFIGLGVSGGEEGALKGPSLMPGGPKQAWELAAPLFEKIAAKVEGEACTAYMGPGGAGHFVKMVHNGIEYGDMQLIAEAYDLLRHGGFAPPELGEIFSRWNSGPLSSFLIEVTAKVFKKKDDSGQAYLVDKILDKAGQKGTGKWTLQSALDLGVSVPTLAAAVDARILSSMKSEREGASKLFVKTLGSLSAGRDQLAKLVEDALYASKIMAYAQGMALLSRASTEWNWNLRLSEIAAIWRGGCIIRARFLSDITRAYRSNPSLSNLLLDSGVQKAVGETVPNLRKVIALAAEAGVPVPAFGASLAYFDSFTTASLPQNLTQAQRDFFGAHTFERIDKAGTFHVEWE